MDGDHDRRVRHVDRDEKVVRWTRNRTAERARRALRGQEARPRGHPSAPGGRCVQGECRGRSARQVERNVTVHHYGPRWMDGDVGGCHFDRARSRRHVRSDAVAARPRGLDPSSRRAHRRERAATYGADHYWTYRSVVRRRRAAAARLDFATSPPTLPAEGDWLRREVCGRSPWSDVSLAHAVAAKRPPGRDGAWNFERAPVNATKGSVRSKPGPL